MDGTRPSSHLFPAHSQGSNRVVRVKKPVKKFDIDFWVQDIASPALQAKPDLPSITLEHIEKLMPGERVPRLNSPRSIKACLEMGVDLEQLAPVSLEDFRDDNVDRAIWMLKYQHARSRRDNLLLSLGILRNQSEAHELLNQIRPAKGDGAVLEVVAAAESTTVQRANARLQRHQSNQRRLNQLRLEELNKSISSLKLLESKIGRENSYLEEKEAERKLKQRRRNESLYTSSMEEVKAERNAELNRRHFRSNEFKNDKAIREIQCRREEELRQLAKQAAKRQAEKDAEWRRRTREIRDNQEARIQRKKNAMLDEEDRRKTAKLLRDQKFKIAKEATAAALRHKLVRAKSAADFNLNRKISEFVARERNSISRRQQMDNKKQWDKEFENEKNKIKQDARLQTKVESERIQQERVSRFIAEAEASARKTYELNAANAFQRQMTVTERRLAFDDRKLKTEMQKKQDALWRYKLKQKIDRDNSKAEYIKEMKDRMQRRAVQANLDASFARKEQQKAIERSLHATYRFQAKPKMTAKPGSVYGQISKDQSYLVQTENIC
jgi:hypothetical protein|tara:strand:- start:1030 stop:2691 length:1662 start_codon:yes stop_codon:yes gene_type:complete